MSEAGNREDGPRGSGGPTGLPLRLLAKWALLRTQAVGVVEAPQHLARPAIGPVSLNLRPAPLQFLALFGREDLVDLLAHLDEQRGQIGVDDAHHVGDGFLTLASDAENLHPLFGSQIELVDGALELIQTRHLPTRTRLRRRLLRKNVADKEAAGHDPRRKNYQRRHDGVDEVTGLHQALSRSSPSAMMLCSTPSEKLV